MHFCWIRSQSHFLNSILFADKSVPSSAPPVFTPCAPCSPTPGSMSTFSSILHLTAPQPSLWWPVRRLQDSRPAAAQLQKTVWEGGAALVQQQPASSSRRRNWSQEGEKAACSRVQWQHCNLSGSRLLVTPTGIGIPPYRRQKLWIKESCKIEAPLI